MMDAEGVAELLWMGYNVFDGHLVHYWDLTHFRAPNLKFTWVLPLLAWIQPLEI